MAAGTSEAVRLRWARDWAERTKCAQDFTADLADDWLTLGLDNTELEYSYAYFRGAYDTDPGYLEVEYCW